MQFAPINIANGTLTTSFISYYTVPDESAAMMRSIVLVNKTASAVTVSVRVRIGPSGSYINVIPPGLELRAYNKFDDNSVITLPAGSVVQASASANASVDFIISGVQAV